MKMQPCPTCNGTGRMQVSETLFTVAFERDCYICEGTGTIPAEEVSHCEACGEPVELGLNWCSDHVPAADLWEALNAEKFIDALLESIKLLESHSEQHHPES